ncbi:exodeoxyribonuclease VII large subunit [candidate division LCP-89 bacterium B3_LCP]|uniref:Exodeoxyribonuclease 7 large subunit n=1 Tax=candidate division LCP-89 bacterium B3_LCP TaxID=2012998 RepID=A0A532V256_UNCL8|nr:MAG: exodeoxyribonuclease VII large subunit [candidate division LCP-89 bacterium B3_LCP]
MSDQPPLSVSEATHRVKTVLEGSIPPLWILGEISGFTRHRSGHTYFTLSDDRSQLSCVLWRGRSQELTFSPEVGQRILAQGKITVYERGGRYQFDCYEIRPAGIGELALAFEALKKRLEAQGYFALERKIPIPGMPERVGLVTSPDGAALRDILKVAENRAPWVEFRLIGAAVQGSAAAGEIAAAIETLDKSNWPQVIIVGRGGGSPEDLWAFNEEKVVRAIAECNTPIVSAVGHEVDVTLADLAADMRAPTPSAAAEMCLPDGAEIAKRLHESSERIHRVLRNRVVDARTRLKEYTSVIFKERTTAIWRGETQRLDMLDQRLTTAGFTFLQKRHHQFDRCGAKLQSLDPEAVLTRGYAVVRRSGEKRPVISSDQLNRDDLIDIAFSKGAAAAVIKDCHPE